MEDEPPVKRSRQHKPSLQFMFSGETFEVNTKRMESKILDFDKNVWECKGIVQSDGSYRAICLYQIDRNRFRDPDNNMRPIPSVPPPSPPPSPSTPPPPSPPPSPSAPPPSSPPPSPPPSPSSPPEFWNVSYDDVVQDLLKFAQMTHTITDVWNRLYKCRIISSVRKPFGLHITIPDDCSRKYTFEDGQPQVLRVYPNNVFSPGYTNADWVMMQAKHDHIEKGAHMSIAKYYDQTPRISW